MGGERLPKNTTQCPWLGIKLGPVDPEMNALTMTEAHLPLFSSVTVITLFPFYRKRKMFLPVKLSQYNIPRDIRRCLLDGGDLGSIVHALREVNKDTGRSSIIGN